MDLAILLAAMFLFAAVVLTCLLAALVVNVILRKGGANVIWPILLVAASWTGWWVVKQMVLGCIILCGG